MILSERFEREFAEVRKLVAEAIRHQKEDLHEPGKSYEGTWEIELGLAGYDVDPQAIYPPDWCKIKLHCYLIGPSRHYEWTESSALQALSRCRRDVEEWCKEAMLDNGEGE